MSDGDDSPPEYDFDLEFEGVQDIVPYGKQPEYTDEELEARAATAQEFVNIEEAAAAVLEDVLV